MFDEIKSTLRGEQLPIFENIVRRINEQIFQTKLGGLAGTGKTYLISRIIQAMNELGLNVKTICPSGKAAEQLRNKGIDATTIHQLMYIFIEEKKFVRRGKDVKQLAFAKREKIDTNIDLLVIDEASMVNVKMYKDITSFGIPIIWVGDYGQLPPVGKDARIMDEAKLDFKLTTINRQQDGSQIVNFAHDIRNGKKWRQSKDDVHIIQRANTNDVLHKYPLMDQYIVPYNDTRIILNNQIREFIGKKKEIEEGEKLICLFNNKKLEVFNGTQFIVKRIFGEFEKLYYADIELDSGKLIENVKLNTTSMNGEEAVKLEEDNDNELLVDYGYAITCHKAQGSEWDNVMVLNRPLPRNWSEARWKYTAVTRAAKNLYNVNFFSNE